MLVWVPVLFAAAWVRASACALEAMVVMKPVKAACARACSASARIARVHPLCLSVCVGGARAQVWLWRQLARTHAQIRGLKTAVAKLQQDLVRPCAFSSMSLCRFVGLWCHL